MLLLNGKPLAEAETDRLARAVVISLFSWRRADATDEWDGKKYGWWGDWNPDGTDRFGSKLYQLMRRAITDEMIPEAQEMCEEALEWLVDEGRADSVTAECSRTDTGTLSAKITVTAGSESSVYDFSEVE